MGTYQSGKDVVGKIGTFVLKHRTQASVEIDVKILDFKRSWGQPRFLVEPKSGTGRIWVEDVQLA